MDALLRSLLKVFYVYGYTDAIDIIPTYVNSSQIDEVLGTYMGVLRLKPELKIGCAKGDKSPATRGELSYTIGLFPPGLPIGLAGPDSPENMRYSLDV